MVARRLPAPPTAQSGRFMPPTGGINTVVPIGDLPPTDCVYAYNLMAGEYGLRTRLGFREWCTGLTGAADNTVRSILPFTGSTASANRLFACTSTGIWDVSSSSAAPTQVLAFASSAGNAGYGTAVVAVTAAGHFLCYCDEVNGYHLYTESTGIWAAMSALSLTGVDPAKLVHVTQWKGRLWFTEVDSARGWYLGVSAIQGAATSFNFAQRFRAGGPLRGLWSWTYDGGGGIDDALVAVSGGGDVCVYKGTDPSTAGAFGMQGAWSLGGAPPAGRRIATDYGGDLLLLSSLGVLPMSKLTIGANVADSAQYATAKISNLFNTLTAAGRALNGWSLRIHPGENALIVTVPTTDGAATEQLAMSLSTKGWFRFSSLPILSGDSYDGTFYFGTADGRVCKSSDYVDGVLLSDPSSYTPVDFRCLTGFSQLGSPRQKIGGLLRPTFLSEGATPAYDARLRWGYDLSDLDPVSGSPVGSGALWDSAVWDSALWGGSAVASQNVRGAAGMGVDCALAFRGLTVARTTFVGADVTYTAGGFL